MSMTKNKITADELRALVNYDPATGLFTDKAGKQMGFMHPDGYVLLNLDGVLYRANRMAWLYATGREPAGEVDHRDFDRANNAFENLREATHVDSARHRRAFRTNLLGMKGVRKHQASGRYEARIKVHGRSKTLGFFDTPDLAGHAYNKAAIASFGEFAVLNPVGRANYGPRGLLPERRRYLIEPRVRKPRGFAAMDPEARRAAQQKGGKALQASGKGHRYTVEEAREAGKKGGKALQDKIRALREKEGGES